MPKHAKILFVGINPHYGSFRNGVPFSNNKSFWYLLSDSKLIKEKRELLKDNAKLKAFYAGKFSSFYKFGFVNLIERPSRNVSQLRKGEEEKGIRRLLRLIRAKQPRVVCFIGKVTYEKFAKTKDCTFGWQRAIGNAKVYVMHFPVRGLAKVRVEELKEIGRV